MIFGCSDVHALWCYVGVFGIGDVVGEDEDRDKYLHLWRNKLMFSIILCFGIGSASYHLSM